MHPWKIVRTFRSSRAAVCGFHGRESAPASCGILTGNGLLRVSASEPRRTRSRALEHRVYGNRALCRTRVSCLDQNGGYVSSIFELYARDVRSEGAHVPFGREPALRPLREEMGDEVPRGLPAFPLLRGTGSTRRARPANATAW